MYRDNPRINFVGIEDDNEAENFIKTTQNSDTKIYRLGFAVGGKKENCLWDENFYLNGTDITMKLLDSTKFYYRRDLESEYRTYKKVLDKNYIFISKEPYAFVHKASSSNIDGINYSKITKGLRMIYTDPSIDFFDYGLIIQKASEIHCVNSSFKHLIERIPTSGKLFYHKNKHLLPYSDMTTTKIWEEV